MIAAEFDLTESRVRRLEPAGVSSLRELAKVLAALDLKAQVRVVWPPFEAIKADPEEES